MSVRIDAVRWSHDEERQALIAIRRAVFVVEQEVPIELELDGDDAMCEHWLARDSHGVPIGTARMQPTGHIGRIAVVSERRRQGIGARIVEAIIDHARRLGLASVDLDSQVHAVGFYEKLGFGPRGDVFMEAGIPHQNMARSLR